MKPPWSQLGKQLLPLSQKPTWQHDGGCSARTVADVAAVTITG
jgi:hypothetical protein